MTLILPRLSSSAPIVGPDGWASVALVKWWNTIASAIESNINAIDAAEAQIDTVLGIANGAAAAAGDALNAASSGLVSVARGGTSRGNLGSHAVIVGEGISPVALVLPGTAGRVLGSNGATNDPSFQTLTSLLDTVFGSTQGSILYRNATAWVVLGPGIAGEKLTSGGAGANVSWT